MNSSCPTGSCPSGPCPADEALSALADAALPSEAGTGLIAHCAGCPRCTRRLAELRALRDAFAALPAIRLEVDLAAQLVDRLQAGATPAARKRRQSPWWVRWADRLRPPTPWRFSLSPFAGSVAAVGLGLWLGGLLMELEAPRSPPAANTTLAAMSVFGAVPPGNLCPRAGACGASGNAR